MHEYSEATNKRGNIFYLTDYDLESHCGGVEKIKKQTSLWCHLGCVPLLFSLVSFKLYDFKLDLVRQFRPYVKLSWGNEIATAINLYANTFLLKKILCNDLRPKLVYMRYGYYSPFLVDIMEKYPTFIEINSDDKTEYPFHLSQRALFYVRMTRNLVLRKAAGFLCVTKELKMKVSKYGKPSIRISNGIDAGMIPFVSYTHNDRPKILFMGEPDRSWHGMEKIKFLAAQLSGFDFEIIGYSGCNTGNAIYYGRVSINSIHEIAPFCDVAISSLSLHVLGLREACPLKSRHYLAMGLPMIYAYDDPDLPEDLPFLLKLPNSENNVSENISAIRSFVKKMFREPGFRNQCRKFCEETLDMREKEHQRLSFMDGVLAERKRNKVL